MSSVRILGEASNGASWSGQGCIRSRDVEFRLYYKMIYDCMRLSFRRIFDVPAPRVARVELGLNQAVLNTLAQET